LSFFGLPGLSAAFLVLFLSSNIVIE
jgi:hypothetical protein